MKKCNLCKFTRSNSDFYNQRASTNGKESKCKLYLTMLRSTAKGVIRIIWNSQLGNSKKRGSKRPKYGKLWLINWVLSQDKYYKLHHNWVMSNYDSKLKPSVDRIDDSIGYTKINIQLMTWAENREKGFNTKKVKNKNISKMSKKIKLYNIL